MRFLIILLFLLFTSLFGKEGTLVVSNPDGTQTIRIPLNYESKSITQFILRGARAEQQINFPLASRWLVLSARLKLTYASSLAIIPERSVLSVSFNEKPISQKWINVQDRGVESSMEAKLSPSQFKEFNRLTINSYQHYTIDHCEDETAPELWTKVDGSNSYIELTVLPKVLTNSLGMIDHYLFDSKNIEKNRIGFVLPTQKSNSLVTAAAITSSAIGEKLKFRDMDMFVTSTIPSNSDVLVLATRDQLKAILTSSFSTGADSLIPKIQNNSILFFANPSNPQYGIICLTGQTDQEVADSAYFFATHDFNLYKGYGLHVGTIKLPEESVAYTAPNYLPLGQKITFREMGQKNTLFKYMYPAPLDIHFKIYPDLFFEEKATIKLNINGIYPRKVRHDSVLNISLNDNFAAQLSFDEKISKELSISELLNFKKSDSFPAYLMGDGNNKLSLQPAMVPFKKGFCELYNLENLQTTILDTSSIELPTVPHWIKMPYLHYFLYGAYPYSVYPDGRKTAIVLNSFSPSNLTAAFKIAFFLGKEIEYPLYRLSVSTSTKNVEDRDIIYVGSYSHHNDELFEKAPVKVVGKSFSAAFPLIYKFIDYLPFYDTNRLEPFRYQKQLEASSASEKHVLVQLFKSPFDGSRSVIGIEYDSPQGIEQGINTLFSKEKTIGHTSDVLIIDTDLDKISSFEIGKKYFLGDLSLLDQMRFYVTGDPLVFSLFSFILVVILAYFVRRFLKHFKEKHHPDV
jgi:hypothetical protein